MWRKKIFRRTWEEKGKKTEFQYKVRGSNTGESHQEEGAIHNKKEVKDNKPKNTVWVVSN